MVAEGQPLTGGETMHTEIREVIKAANAALQIMDEWDDDRGSVAFKYETNWLRKALEDAGELRKV